MCCEFDFISFLLLLFCRRFSLFALHAAPALVFGSFSLSLLLHFKVSNAQNPKNIPPDHVLFINFICIYMYDSILPRTFQIFFVSDKLSRTFKVTYFLNRSAYLKIELPFQRFRKLRI